MDFFLIYKMQAAYVLCRLFHKRDEKADNSKYDEVEPSGSSPTTVKSSPDDTSPDMFQEPLILDLQVGKQPKGIERWLTDKSDDMTYNSLLHVESCISDIEDHSTEAVTTEVWGIFDVVSAYPLFFLLQNFIWVSKKLQGHGFLLLLSARYTHHLKETLCVMNPGMLLIARFSVHYCHMPTRR